VFTPANFSRPPNPVTGEHGYNTRTQFGDFDLTILPKNETIRFNVGYSPERYSGAAFTNHRPGGNEFVLLNQLRSRANDFRVGADGKVGPIAFSFLQGFRRFRDDSFIDHVEQNHTNVFIGGFKARPLSDWTIYLYYNYNESTVVGPRPQNYHAHLPYTSLRVYFVRRE